MSMYRVGFIVVLFVACKNAGGGRSQSRDTPSVLQKDTTPPQAMTLAKRPAGPRVDTVLKINIDDVSLEGSEVKARYIRDTLRSAEWEISGETYQTLVNFTFSWDGRIQVKEKSSRYKLPLGDAKSDKDMVVDSFLYRIDTNGVFLSGRKAGLDTGNIRESFNVFKQNVPMILKP